MKKTKRVLTLILAVILTAATLFSFAACGKPYYSVTYQALRIEGLEETKYVMCVSKEIEDAEAILNALNKVIREQGDKIVQEYLNPPTRGGSAQDAFQENYRLSSREDDDPVIVYSQVYDPFDFGGLAGGSYAAGIDVVITHLAAHSLGRSVQFLDRPIEFGKNYVRQGYGHILAAAIPYSADLEKDFYITDVYASGYQCILSNSRQKFTKLEDLEGLYVGVMKGRPGEALLRDAVEKGILKNVTIRVYDTDIEVKNDIIKYNLDVAIMDEYPATLVAQYLGRKYIFK